MGHRQRTDDARSCDDSGRCGTGTGRVTAHYRAATGESVTLNKNRMDISQVTDYLYVGAQPSAQDAEQLHALNVRLIISMAGTIRPPKALAQPPLRLLWL